MAHSPTFLSVLPVLEEKFPKKGSEYTCLNPTVHTPSTNIKPSSPKLYTLSL